MAAESKRSMLAKLVSGRDRVLNVPYFVQPTPVTCQATCLKMMGSYIDAELLRRTSEVAAEDIPAIWKEINESKERPVKAHNAHANMKWWLEKHYPPVRFEYVVTAHEEHALQRIIEFIDGGIPVLVSVSHSRVHGHIVLVVGYENYQPNASTLAFHLVVHDPYGRFDPNLLSNTYGKKRFEGGMSLKSGGSVGPGQNCRLPITAVSRQRYGDARIGTYYLLSGRR